MGSKAYFSSYNTKMVPRTTDMTMSPITIGCAQGRDCPPILNDPSKEVIVIARRTAPMKSTLLNFDGCPFGCTSLATAKLGSLIAIRIVAKMRSGP
jgi:hypothetical protein